ncbi:hypothetical protein C2845_PM07G21830 [Panicum miliaceum]|uniref:Uncharacterized protein n=1 Tax=Panicum miliaceum TaxID=4540 RepID=A0A3L6SLG6_PANMI|nr:hypothetical protein C2845_PM07G21830 [Panicum miliaceum]
MKPVMRSTEWRRWLSSRARPGPDRSANAAGPSDRRRDTSTCGGTIVPLRPKTSSSSSSPLRRAAERAAGLGMSTGREPSRRGASGTPRRAGVLDRGASAADDELQPGGAVAGASSPSSWGASGHSTSDSQSSSAIAIALDRFVVARLIGSRCACALRGRTLWKSEWKLRGLG